MVLEKDNRIDGQGPERQVYWVKNTSKNKGNRLPVLSHGRRGQIQNTDLLINLGLTQCEKSTVYSTTVSSLF